MMKEHKKDCDCCKKEHDKDRDHKKDCGCCKKEHDKNCVCEAVRKIHKAQEEASEHDSCCKVSCENSIKQLHSCHKVTANTIPFSLVCGCDPFIGRAFATNHWGDSCFISSPFFKVKKIKDHCCAVLELLWPTCNGHPFSGHFLDDMKGCSHSNKTFNGFVGTGACITVDLNCFCSISCHKATDVEKATENQLRKIFKANKCC